MMPRLFVPIVYLECDYCGRSYIRRAADHKWQMAQGNRQVFCSRSCADKGRKPRPKPYRPRNIPAPRETVKYLKSLFHGYNVDHLAPYDGSGDVRSPLGALCNAILDDVVAHRGARMTA